MRRPFVLTLEPEGASSWRVVAQVGALRPSEPARVPLPVLGKLAVDAGDEVFAARLDVAWGRAEVAAGRALAGWLCDAGPAGAAWLRQVGASTPTQGIPVVVDAQGPPARELPWELLADDARGLPLEESGVGGVARRLARVVAAPPFQPRARLRLAAWSPTPGDPVCAAHLAFLDGLARHVLGEPLHILSAEPPWDDECAWVLHVVCHGRLSGDVGALEVGERLLAPGTAAHVLRGMVAHAALVVLDVCEGGAATLGERETVAARLTAIGAHAVVAPRVPCARRAAGAFAEGCLRALAEGIPLGEAVFAGRRAVRALGVGAADSRWFNHQVFVADADALLVAPVRPSLTLARLLRDAKDRARADGRGFLGVEHAARALVDAHGGSGLAEHLRAALRDGLPRLWNQSAALHCRDDARTAPVTTPRLARLVESAGGDLARFLDALAADPGNRLHEVARASLQQVPTFYGSIIEVNFGPEAAALEVHGGPEDGRRIPLVPGVSVGIAGSGAAEELYSGTSCSDPDVSGVILRIRDDGALEVPASAVQRRRGARVRHRGLIVPVDGDVLLFSEATRLRVVGIPSNASNSRER